MQKKKILIVSLVVLFCILIGVVFAVFEGQKNTITFDANGGTIEKKQIKINYGSKYELPSPTKSDFVFGGWYYDGKYVESIGDSWEYDFDLTLVAEWIIRDDSSFVYEQNENGYSIVDYRGVANDEIFIPTELNSVKVVSIKDGAFSKLSKILTSDGKKTRILISDEISFDAEKIGLSSDSAEIIKYSSIDKDGYYYADNGDYLSVVYYSGNYANDLIVPMGIDDKPVKEIGSYLFSGATSKVTHSDFTYPRILIPNTINKIGKNSFADCNGIKVSVYYYNAENKLREVTDPALLFDWNENLILEDGNGELLDVITQIRPAFGWSIYSSAKLYIKLDANGGVVPNNANGITVTIRKEYSLPTPTRDGYDFAGWYYGDNLVPQAGEKWGYSKHVKLTAKWSEK